MVNDGDGSNLQAYRLTGLQAYRLTGCWVDHVGDLKVGQE
ncbi:MAG: hypothetical protein ACI9YG_000284 [Candidatus Azotimanducaceae bacterium]|jgi:hypothetical protein